MAKLGDHPLQQRICIKLAGFHLDHLAVVQEFGLAAR
jgi:hypothetical protein